MKRPIRFVTSVGTALLLAANAGVTASATTEWHADGRDGAQVLDGFSLTEVYRDKQVYDWAFAPEPGGHSFLALRRELDAKTMMDTGASVVRFTADDQGRLSQSVVLDIEALRDPVLWDAGVDLAAADLYTDALSVAPSGDAFVSAGASMDGTIAASTLVRIAPDGSLQKVVTAGELGATGIFPPAIRYPWVHVVAASDGVLWGHAEGYDPSTDQLTRLIQIADPTDDGDWSDRIVRPLVLSASIPQLEDGVWDWRYGDFVPDGLAADADGPGSVLFPIIGRNGDYQVHRLTDTRGDGILDVAGESELIFRHQSDPGSLWMIAPRLTAGAPGDGTGLSFVGLTDNSRVSVSSNGEAQDIIRGLYNPSGVTVLANGSLYVGVAGEHSQSRGLPYSVLRVAPGDGARHQATEPAAPEATLAPPGLDLVPRGLLTPGVPLVKTQLFGPDGEEMLLFYGADGSGPTDVLPGIQTRSWGCQSLDGDLMAIHAEIDVPNEDSLYLVDPTGAQAPRLLSESHVSVLCPFREDAIAVVHATAQPFSASRIDLGTGETTTLVDDIPGGLWPALSPDGRWLAMASGEDGTTLRVADLADGTVRVLAEGLPASILNISWSRDASRLAFATTDYDPLRPVERQAGQHEVWVLDTAASGTPERVFSLPHTPELTWSPNGRQLAIKANSESEYCCEFQGELTILDLESGATRLVAPDASFGEWSPADPTVFAWGTLTRLVIEQGGTARDIAAPRVKTKDGREPIRWTGVMGWSPDGRYLGFNYPRLTTVDSETGETRVVLDGRRAVERPVDAAWWRGSER